MNCCMLQFHAIHYWSAVICGDLWFSGTPFGEQSMMEWFSDTAGFNLSLKFRWQNVMSGQKLRYSFIYLPVVKIPSWNVSEKYDVVGTKNNESSSWIQNENENIGIKYMLCQHFSYYYSHYLVDCDYTGWNSSKIVS